MARRVILSDDFDGTESEDVTTYRFAVFGAFYEIDLNEHNAAAMNEYFKVYTDKARKSTQLSHSANPSRNPDAEAIRAWAKAQPENAQWQVGDKGRLSEEVTKAYENRNTVKPDENGENGGGDVPPENITKTTESAPKK